MPVSCRLHCHKASGSVLHESIQLVCSESMSFSGSLVRDLPGQVLVTHLPPSSRSVIIQFTCIWRNRSGDTNLSIFKGPDYDGGELDSCSSIREVFI
jgi:hypothetical protein